MSENVLRFDQIIDLQNALYYLREQLFSLLDSGDLGVSFHDRVAHDGDIGAWRDILFCSFIASRISRSAVRMRVEFARPLEKIRKGRTPIDMQYADFFDLANSHCDWLEPSMRHECDHLITRYGRLG
jgi:hypothetical protein